MKIVMFGHKRIPSREGGVEVVVQNLCSRMAAQGHEVLCLNRGGHHVSGQQFDSQKSSEYEGIKLKQMPTINKKGLAAVSSSFFAALYCAFQKTDVVHIHAEGPAFWCWIPKLFRKKVIVSIHGLDWAREKWSKGFASRYIRWGEKMAVRYADEIVVLSRNMQQYFRENYGRKTVLIPNGAEQPRYLPADRIKRQYALSKDSYVLFLGRLVPEKGIHYLLEAFRQVDTGMKLVISGGSSDSDQYVQQLKELAAKDERVLFTGFVQGELLQELYSNCYLYVLPSDLEGMPLSLLEAMSYGNCCLTSDIPECCEVTEDHAVSFPKGNTAVLKERLQELCSHPELVEQYRSSAAEHVRRHYHWDHIVQQYLDLYGE